MVHLQITHEKKGKWSEPNLQGCNYRIPISSPLLFFDVFFWRLRLLPFLKRALSSAFRHTVFFKFSRLKPQLVGFSNVHPLFISWGNISIYFSVPILTQKKTPCFFFQGRDGEKKNTTSYRTEVQPTLVAARCLDIWSYICHTLTWPIGCVVCL